MDEMDSKFGKRYSADREKESKYDKNLNTDKGHQS